MQVTYIGSVTAGFKRSKTPQCGLGKCELKTNKIKAKTKKKKKKKKEKKKKKKKIQEYPVHSHSKWQNKTFMTFSNSCVLDNGLSHGTWIKRDRGRLLSCRVSMILLKEPLSENVNIKVPAKEAKYVNCL